MRKLVIIALALLTLGTAAPAVAATGHHHSPRIAAGTPIYLQINTNNCLNSNGVNQQLTSDNAAGGCTNWHGVSIGSSLFLMENGANNCMRENNSNQITVVSNCNSSDAQQQWQLFSCGTNCYKYYSSYFGNNVSVTGPASGDKVWGGNDHIDWLQF